MTKTINWTDFSDEMPKENDWYLFAMEGSIPMLGYLFIDELKDGTKLYCFEYYRGNTKCAMYFDEKDYHGLYAWVLDKDLF